jgi:hypothetical protein
MAGAMLVYGGKKIDIVRYWRVLIGCPIHSLEYVVRLTLGNTVTHPPGRIYQRMQLAYQQRPRTPSR